MKCNNCGNIIENPNNNFCTYCGSKIEKNDTISNSVNPNQNTNINNSNMVNNNVNNNNPNNTQNNTTTFLDIGIIMAMCCSMPFGAGVILLNELKYKKELQTNQLDAAKKTKNMMIALIVIGVLLTFAAAILQIILIFIENSSSTYGY